MADPEDDRRDDEEEPTPESVPADPGPLAGAFPEANMDQGGGFWSSIFPPNESPDIPAQGPGPVAPAAAGIPGRDFSDLVSRAMQPSSPDGLGGLFGYGPTPGARTYGEGLPDNERFGDPAKNYEVGSDPIPMVRGMLEGSGGGMLGQGLRGAFSGIQMAAARPDVIDNPGMAQSLKGMFGDDGRTLDREKVLDNMEQGYLRRVYPQEVFDKDGKKIGVDRVYEYGSEKNPRYVTEPYYRPPKETAKPAASGARSNGPLGPRKDPPPSDPNALPDGVLGDNGVERVRKGSDGVVYYEKKGADGTWTQVGKNPDSKTLNETVARLNAQRTGQFNKNVPDESTNFLPNVQSEPGSYRPTGDADRDYNAGTGYSRGPSAPAGTHLENDGLGNQLIVSDATGRIVGHFDSKGRQYTDPPSLNAAFGR